MSSIKKKLIVSLGALVLVTLGGCPFQVDTDGTIKIVNDTSGGSSLYITRVNIDDNCYGGWSGERNSTIDPESGSKSFDKEADTYDVRVCNSSNSTTTDGCVQWFDVSVDADETTTLRVLDGQPVPRYGGC